MKITKKRVVVYGRYYKSELFEDINHYYNKVIKYMNKHKDLILREYYEDYIGKIEEFYKLITLIYEERVDVLIVLGGIDVLPTDDKTLSKIAENVEIIEIY